MLAIALMMSAASTELLAEQVAPAKCSDPLDALLDHAGMRRADLGWSARGWWIRYPHTTLHKLDHFDDLLREPLAAIPFTRTLAEAGRVFLGREGLVAPPPHPMVGGYSPFRLLHTVVDRRYSGVAYASARLDEEAVPLDRAVVALYRSAGEPTQFRTNFLQEPLPDLEKAISHKAAGITPEVSRIIGRLILDVVDAHRWAELAFRNVTLEQRLQIARRTEFWNELEVNRGLDYTHLHVFDDVAKAWDEGSLWYGALKSVEALDRARRALSVLPPAKLGSASFDWRTPLGWIRVRGTGRDTIDAADALLIVDLGGDDIWRGPAGASSPERVLGLALDLSGNDTYEGESSTQGAGITGVGLLLDAAGNDRYAADSYAQGVGQFGLGALIDFAGNDVYRAGHSTQGGGFFGIGLLADVAGDDRYEIRAGVGQGFGGPGGVGVLTDRAGNDSYYAEPDSQKSGRPYPLNGGVTASSSNAQGVGVGRWYDPVGGRSWAGGLGALLDIEGDDSYTAGSWSQGMGYWFGTGLLYDGTGDDHYTGGARWTQASAAHYAIGVLLDEAGNDVHAVQGTFGLATAHDFSVALFVANGGNDRYSLAGDSRVDARMGDGFGSSLNRSVGMFIDTGGDDIYKAREGSRPGFALYDVRFQTDSAAKGVIDEPSGVVNPYFGYVSSIAAFLDVGGTDTYWGGLADGASWRDEPGSDNWQVRNVGVGADVAAGTIDWRPAMSPRDSASMCR